MSLVDISPDVLEYKSPLTRQSTAYVTVKNNSDQAIAFKVKTTAPKFYCVRPNASVVAPGEIVDVQVIFLGLPEAPAPDYKCRDKFLVITLPSPYDLGSKSVSEAWADLEAEFKQQAISKKIKVKYLIDTEVEKNPQSVPETEDARETIQPVHQPAPIAETKPSEVTENKMPMTKEVPVAAPVTAAPITVDIEEKKAMPKTETHENVDELKEEPPVTTTEKEEAKVQSSVTKKSGNEGSTNTMLIVICLAVLILGWLYR